MTGWGIKKTPKIMHHSKANCRGAFPHLRLVVVTRGFIGSRTGTATIREKRRNLLLNNLRGRFQE